MSLRKALADLAAGRPISAAAYQRIEALCREADGEALANDAEAGAPRGRRSPRTERPAACGRCGTISRSVYCPNCGDRV